jgi:hypothetical protein
VYHVFSSGNIVKSSARAETTLSSPRSLMSPSSPGADSGSSIFVEIQFEAHTVTTPRIARFGQGTDVTVDLSLSFLVKNPQSRLLLLVFEGDPASTSRKLIGEASFSIFDVVDHMTLLRFGGNPEMYYERGPTPAKGPGMQWHALQAEGKSQQIGHREEVSDEEERRLDSLLYKLAG